MQRKTFTPLATCALLFAVVVYGVVHPRHSHAESKLTVMTSGGFTAASLTLFPAFERKAACKIVVVYGASMGNAPDAIPNRLQRGEPADVVILASDALAQLEAQGKIVKGSRVNLAGSLIGMAVRAGL